MTRRLKKPVIYSLYAIGASLLVLGIVFVEKSTNSYQSDEERYQYVSETGIEPDEEIPVVNTKETINRPYNDNTVKIVKKFYDYKDTEENQEEAIIYYENSYIQSDGIAYSNGKSFDVTAILPGVVESVEEDDITGNKVTIKHNNGIKSIYESVTDIKVKKGDSVTQGQKIATSGTSNMQKELNNHLYFKLTINDKTVNPEQYFDKTTDTIKTSKSN